MSRPLAEVVLSRETHVPVAAEPKPAPKGKAGGVMPTGKTLEYIKRWRALEGRRKELDYDVSRWCHDVRSEFPTGKPGDEMLRDWIDAQLDLAAHRREEILERANAFVALPDRAQYEGLGGFSNVRKLPKLPRREQVAAIGEAKASGRLLGPIVRERLNEKFSRKMARWQAAQPPRPVRHEVAFSLSQKEFAAWQAAAKASGKSMTDWALSVCNTAAKSVAHGKP